jgi:hypothetical protein
MPHEIPSIRIWPMSSQIPGFRGREIADVQQKCFLCDMPRQGGQFRYRSAGLNAPPNTIVLFQFQAHIIASAIFMRDERFKRPLESRSGQLHFEPDSIRTFTPIDLDGIRAAWPRFRAFGHVKQYLNPECYPAFLKQLKQLKSPTTSNKTAARRAKRVEI